MTIFANVKEEYKEKLEKGKLVEKENLAFFKKLKRKQKKELDQIFHEEHDLAFEEINCLECANCCKTTSPIFTGQDIKRLSKLFKMKIPKFISEYLRSDEDNDYVLKSSPCTFLMEDNTCFIYNERPQACRDYPHTNRKNMFQVLDLTKKNFSVCPAVNDIVENLKKQAYKA